MEFKIISLNVGKIGELVSKNGKVVSAYSKQPVATAELSKTGFNGDEQADLKRIMEVLTRQFVFLVLIILIPMKTFWKLVKCQFLLLVRTLQ